MKKFILRLFFCLFPLLVIAVTMEILIRNIPNNYSYKAAYLKENANQIENLVLGSSHAYFGVNPHYLDGNSFNAGSISQSIDLDLKIIKKYQIGLKNLNFILLPIDYFSLFSRMSEGVEEWRTKDYTIYYKMDIAHSISDCSELLSTNFKLNATKLYNYYYSHKTSISCSKLGFGNQFKKRANLVETGKTAALRHTKKIESSRLKESIGILNSMIEFASVHQTKIIFYTSPAYFSYVSHLDKTQMELTVNTMDSIVKANPNCYYYNLLENKEFVADDYRDADHLNPKGAKKLSLLLNGIMEEIRN